MENLVSTNGKTTSIKVAEVFEKEHKHVLRDIESLSCSPEFRESNFGPSYYTSKQGKQLPMYELTKDGFSFLVMGYTGVRAGQFKELFINEFNKRTEMLRQAQAEVSQFKLPQNMSEALRAYADELEAKEKLLREKADLEEQNRLQSEQLKLSAPKVEFVERVLASDSLIQTTIIAKELGMSAMALNKVLKQRGVIYMVGKSWVLYSKYQNKGYTGTKTYTHTGSDGNPKSSVQTLWTEKGKAFIHSLLNPRLSRPIQVTMMVGFENAMTD